MKEEDLSQNPIEITMGVIGGKHKINIIYQLIDNTLRFNELLKAIPKITPRVLSNQLKELEQHKLIKRVLYPVVPLKIEYSLTRHGETLIPIIKEIYKWGKKNRKKTIENKEEQGEKE